MLAQTQGALHSRAAALSRVLLGDDTDFDFDSMCAKKKRGSPTPTSLSSDDLQGTKYWRGDVLAPRRGLLAGHARQEGRVVLGMHTVVIRGLFSSNPFFFPQVALDEATVDNGTMWFGPGSHKLPTRPHRPGRPGHHVLQCDYDAKDAVSVPMSAGSCTFHHGNTLHYTKGNTTSSRRRAFITNFRPKVRIIVGECFAEFCLDVYCPAFPGHGGLFAIQGV